MRHLIVAATAAVLAAGPLRADNDALKARVEMAEAQMKRFQALHKQGVLSAQELQNAELTYHRERAELARVDGDKKAEQESREAVVSVYETRLKQHEKLLKAGAASKEEVDGVRLNLAVSKLELAIFRGKRDAMVTGWKDVVAIAERRAAAGQELHKKGAIAKEEYEDRMEFLERARQRLRDLGDDRQ